MNEKWNNVSHIILVGSIIYSEDNNSIQIIELDHELPIAKFRHKLRKVDKTARPFRHDLNQIPYDYAMEVTNRFKGLELIDRLPEHCRRGGEQNHPQEKEMQKG